MRETRSNDRTHEENTLRTPATELRELPIEAVRPSPFQPRLRPHTKSDVADLMRAIEAAGQLTPILVSPGAENGTFVVHSGHRRLAALKALGAATVKAEIHPVIAEQQARKIGLAANLGREDLTAYEQATSVRDYAKACDCSFDDAAVELGIARRTAFRLKSLLGASSKLQAVFKDAQIPAKPADLLAKLERKSARRALQLASQYADGKLTAAALETAQRKTSALRRGVVAQVPVQLDIGDEVIALKVRLVREAMSSEDVQRLKTALETLLAEVGLSAVQAAPAGN